MRGACSAVLVAACQTAPRVPATRAPASAGATSHPQVTGTPAPRRAADDVPVVGFPEEPPPRNDVTFENNVPVRMRDGVVLYADVLRPAGEGRYPVLISRTPYSTERPHRYDEGLFFAQRGYVFVFQDVRGRHESEGQWDPFRDDIRDGYDTIEWAAAQTWSTGQVALQGHSYGGQVQWRAAMSSPPHLVTMFPLAAATSPYHDWVTQGGAWRLAFNFGWCAIRQETRVMQNDYIHRPRGGPEELSYERILWTLPLQDMPRAVGRESTIYRTWMAHPSYDDYWRAINAEEVLEDIPIPVHSLGGWFDIFAQGTLRGYQGMRARGGSERARRYSFLTIGPWGHAPSVRYGELDFGDAAYFSQAALQLRWYDHWLKGVDNGVDREPPVRIFIMGRNEWRFENEYPLARTRYTPMYLHSEGHANSARGDGRLSWSEPGANEPADRFDYDPQLPVPSVGGHTCCGAPVPEGPRDQRELEARDDVLVYTSARVEDELEVTGPVKLVLYASSDALDTDFVVKLVDVYPSGEAYNMAEGVLRARYRDGLDRPRLLERGRVYRLEVDLVGTSVAFQPGHRVRVDITSSHFPQFDRNPNTGAPLGASAETRVARQTVYHSRVRPSHILLPVIPAEGDARDGRPPRAGRRAR